MTEYHYKQVRVSIDGWIPCEGQDCSSYFNFNPYLTQLLASFKGELYTVKEPEPEEPCEIPL